MIYFLAKYCSAWFPILSVLHYTSLRCIIAALLSFCVSIIFGPIMISYLKSMRIRQVIRELGPKQHYVKTGTPTMGGILILFAIIVSTLMCANLNNLYVWVVLFTMLGYGVVGFIDDYLKLAKQNSNGVSAKWKLLSQFFITSLGVLWLFLANDSSMFTTLYMPFLKHVSIDLGVAYLIFGLFVVIGTSNAVNLTDGLDGLAILPVVLVASGLGVCAYLSGHIQFANYLIIPYISSLGEITVVCAAIVGAGLGFLWFNAYPAEVFMGDVGSLSLGAGLGMIAIVAHQEILLAIMGGVFVIEAVSVILQVASFKLTGRRIFRMAPLHHHFELKGWAEPKVIVRFWIITLILVLVSLATLKLR